MATKKPNPQGGSCDSNGVFVSLFNDLETQLKKAGLDDNATAQVVETVLGGLIEQKTAPDACSGFATAIIAEFITGRKSNPELTIASCMQKYGLNPPSPVPVSTLTPDQLRAHAARFSRGDPRIQS